MLQSGAGSVKPRGTMSRRHLGFSGYLGAGKMFGVV